MHQNANVTGVPWAKVVLWTVLFQLAWNWRSVPELLAEGVMPDPDDFLRLQQVRDWLGGQGWYDLAQHRFDPPAGADIHWSRIVDLPLGGLGWLFQLFLDETLAFRLVALIWPTILLVVVAMLFVAICRAVADRFNALLPVLFTVTCLTALAEFRPGRIDHHNVQIALFCVALLGIVETRWRWGYHAAGASMAVSFAIGMDAFPITAVLFAWIGLQWALGIDHDGARMRSAGIGLAAAALVLFPVSVAPAQWALARCDALSITYLTTFLAVAIGFVLLSAASHWSDGATMASVFAKRMLLGGAVAGACGILVLLAFPQCAGGPLSVISPELTGRWLVKVNEAMDVFERAEAAPELWFTAIGYSLFLLVIGLVVVLRHARDHPGLLAMYATLVMSVLAAAFQYRILRIGIFASIPLCVLFVAMAIDWARARFSGFRLAGGAAGAIAILLCAAPVWFVTGSVALTLSRPAQTASGAANLPEWKKGDEVAPFCNRQDQYAELAKLPDGLVMSDLNSGPPILVFTRHSAIGGPYHRNERAILDMLDFFETDLAKSREIADRRQIDFVYFCETGGFTHAEAQASDSMAAHIVLGTEPDWLERLTPLGQRHHLFRVR